MSKTFSGKPTTDPLALDRVLAESKSVRITSGGCLVYSSDPNANVLDPRTPKVVRLLSDDELVHVRDASTLSELREALAISGFDDLVCMCPGDLALEFLDAREERLTVVRIDSPGSVHWPLWAGKATVVDPRALRQWLRRQGADGPLVAVEEHRAKWGLA